MAKNDLLKRNDQRPVVAKGELVPVATVVQIDRLTVAGPYSGDFQIKNGGRLIVGEDPDSGARVIIGSYGQFGYSANGTNTFSLYNATVGTHAPGDLHLGNLAQNYLLYQQSTGTLGLYTPQGAGFIARRDGTLQAGLASGAHMLWNAADAALQVRYADDVKINLGADGNASFDGTIYAAGGRIYGTLAVDDVLRAGDVDGPAVYLGRFERDTGTETIRTAEIIATDDKNLPWFHVVAGGETLPGYFHLGGTGDYDQHLNYDGATLEVDGTIRAQGGEIVSMDVSGQLTVSGEITFGGGRGRLDSTGMKLETSQSGDEGYNVVKWVQDLSVSPLVDVFSIFTEQALGQTIVTLAGPTAGTTPSPGVSASTIKLQPIADSGGDAHIYLQPKVGSTVSPELKVSSALGVTISSTTTKIGDGGSTNYAQFDAAGTLTLHGSAKIINTESTPASASATGTKGQIVFDGSYVYVCTATDTWRRAEIKVW